MPEAVKVEVPSVEVAAVESAKVEVASVEATEVEVPRVELEEESAVASKSRLKPLFSLSSLLNGEEEKSSEPELSGDEQGEQPQVAIEANVDEKLEAARDGIIEYVKKMRPRFVATFEAMTFDSGVINIAVPSLELQEEILRMRTELLTAVVAIADIKGRIELYVELNEEIRAARPIRLEDRVAHVIKVNPYIEDLRKRFDLMIE